MQVYIYGAVTKRVLHKKIHFSSITQQQSPGAVYGVTSASASIHIGLFSPSLWFPPLISYPVVEETESVRDISSQKLPSISLSLSPVLWLCSACSDG